MPTRRRSGVSPPMPPPLRHCVRASITSSPCAPSRRAEFLGIWETVGGVVIIKRGKGGSFDVDAETFGDPLWGNRYCAGGGDFTMRGAALLSANGRREWKQRLTRR